MVKNELQQFIRYNDMYKTMCTELLESFHFSENTVAAFTRCGTTTGTAFLTGNFTRIFGYPRTAFIKGDLQFLIKHIHPDDLPAFVFFAESSTLQAATWNEVKENAVQEHCCRFKHGNGKWIWIKQKVIVLSVTPERHIDAVLLLFDDCTAAKQAEFNQHVLRVEKSRRNSKLLRLLAPVSSTQIRKEKLMLTLKEHASLTQREKEIMQLVSQGSSSKEIAAKLFISKHTVETHRKHILHKLSVKNAPQMVHQTLISSVE
ncbi:MAG TPA: LuxR C-terminal-related transcriptional regulator [Parafilimonas sp.]|nr:LuxR C-terminal-related transcriptional regulator [Parafilimonas sp.]